MQLGGTIDRPQLKKAWNENNPLQYVTKDTIYKDDWIEKIRVNQPIKKGYSYYQQIMRDNTYTQLESGAGVTTPDNNVIFFPLSHSQWALASEKSKYIIDENGILDEEGEVTHYSLETWKRTINFLSSMAYTAHSKDYKLMAPVIFDGDDGSIDVRWKNEQSRLLINIPNRTNEPISFHGDNINGRSIKGMLDDIEVLISIFVNILKPI